MNHYPIGRYRHRCQVLKTLMGALIISYRHKCRIWGGGVEVSPWPITICP